ncbi:MAG: diacylglycerol/lipid kinase family protein, partial [Gemmataceae bacterium]
QSTKALAWGFSIGQREGGFPLYHQAQLDDGLFESLRVGAVWRYEMIRHLPGMIRGQLPQHPELHQQQCESVMLTSHHPLVVHLDGEVILHPEDQVREVQLTIERGRLATAVDLRHYRGRK